MKNFLLLILPCIFWIVSCESTHKNAQTREFTVTGKVGEILVVCDNGIWNSEIKNQLDTGLTRWIMPYFPDVATFELVHKTPGHFTQGVKRWRNTLFLTIDPGFKGKKGSIVRREDVWAKGQLVIEITANNYNQLLETCRTGLDEVHAQFDKYEWQRLIRYFKGSKNESTRKKIRENFGIDIVLPNKSAIVTHKKNFFRIEFPPGSRPIEFVGVGEDVGSIFSGVMIYQYDFVDSSQLEPSRLLRDRDTMLKYNVPHEIDGLYMGTQYDPRIYPESNIAYNGTRSIKGIEMRGMFYFTGRQIHSTGGAFWAYHFVNPKTKKIVALSGYVDAPPTTSWTHPLREVQAILKSVEVVK